MHALLQHSFASVPTGRERVPLVLVLMLVLDREEENEYR